MVQQLRQKLTKDKISNKQLNGRFMNQNVKLIADINILVKEQHVYDKNIQIMGSVTANGMIDNNDIMNDARVSDAEKELKMQETVME